MEENVEGESYIYWGKRGEGKSYVYGGKIEDILGKRSTKAEWICKWLIL